MHDAAGRVILGNIKSVGLCFEDVTVILESSPVICCGTVTCWRWFLHLLEKERADRGHHVTINEQGVPCGPSVTDPVRHIASRVNQVCCQ